MTYDLLIKGGHVLDPGQGIDGVMDIAISGGKIAAMAPEIAPEAKRVIEIKGPRRLVTPGLIDLHTHCAYGLQSPGVNWQAVDPELAGVRSGVTTIVDCGTCGAYDFGVVPTYIAPNVKTRTIWFLNIGSFGLLTQPLHKPRAEITSLSDVDIESTLACARANPDLIKGIKLRLVGPAIESIGPKLIDLALEAAQELSLPLMTHIGDILTQSPKAPELTHYLLARLRPGDIITHVCTSRSGGVLDANGRVLPQARDAQNSGIVMDPAFGRSNWNYSVCRAEAEQGFHPDTISTDMSTPGRATAIYSLMEAMSRFMACGYGLTDVVRMTTINPARALGMQDSIGAIRPGYEADLTIMDEVTGDWRFIDSFGNVFHGERAFIPVSTIKSGEIFSPDWGPRPWGWLPESR